PRPRDPPVAFHSPVAVGGHRLVHRESRTEDPAVWERAAHAGHYDRERLHEVRSGPEPHAPFHDGFPGTAQVEMLEIPQPAVHDAQAVLGRAAAEIATIDERRAQPAAHRFQRYARAGDATAHDQHVELRIRQL